MVVVLGLKLYWYFGGADGSEVVMAVQVVVVVQMGL